MTYNVFGGTLNLAQSINLAATSNEVAASCKLATCQEETTILQVLQKNEHDLRR